MAYYILDERQKSIINALGDKEFTAENVEKRINTKCLVSLGFLKAVDCIIANTDLIKTDNQTNTLRISKPIGEAIRDVRIQKKMRLKDVAVATGYSLHAIEQFEKGKTNTKVKTLDDILKALGVTVKIGKNGDI